MGTVSDIAEARRKRDASVLAKANAYGIAMGLCQPVKQTSECAGFKFDDEPLFDFSNYVPARPGITASSLDERTPG